MHKRVLDPQLYKDWQLLCYMVWLASLGAVGSIAFIGMNALSVQEDATFDLTNHRLIALRIALGALFGVVLTLPFGFQSFGTFITDLREGGRKILEEASKGQDSSALLLPSVLLLLPFVLGFSTPLVIMVLNQFVEAVQSFFGKKSPLQPAPAVELTAVAFRAPLGPSKNRKRDHISRS